MHLPRVRVVLNMNLHPIRASLPTNLIPSHLTEGFTVPSNLGDFTTEPVTSPNSPSSSAWDLSHGFPVSWNAALAVDILVLILLILGILLAMYLLRRHYKREKLRRLIASVHERPNANDEEIDLDHAAAGAGAAGVGVGAPSRTLASRLKMGNPLTKIRAVSEGAQMQMMQMRMKKKVKKSHARWGSDATWSAEIGKIGSEGQDEKSKAKVSMEEGGGVVDWNAKVLVYGDEKQTRKNLRGSGHDTFRGT